MDYVFRGPLEYTRENFIPVSKSILRYSVMIYKSMVPNATVHVVLFYVWFCILGAHAFILDSIFFCLTQKAALWAVIDKYLDLPLWTTLLLKMKCLCIHNKMFCRYIYMCIREVTSAYILWGIYLYHTWIVTYTK